MFYGPEKNLGIHVIDLVGMVLEVDSEPQDC
jgi:hypothetical protein